MDSTDANQTSSDQIDADPADAHGPTTRGWVASVVSRWVAWSPVTLLVTLVVVIAAHVPASRLQLDQSIESMFDPDDPVVVAFEKSRQTFGGDEFVFVAYPAPELYVTSPSADGRRDVTTVNEDVLEEVKAFAERLGQVPGVAAESTQDLGHMLRPEGDDLPRGIRLILRFPTITEKAMTFAEAVLVSPDRTTVGIALRLKPAGDDPVGRGETIQQIRDLGATHDPPAIVVGEPVQIADTFRYIEQDGALLGWSSAALLSIVILSFFRRLRWVILPLLVVYSALVLTEATLVLSGLTLSMVSSVLSALITVIGIATVMHVIVHYRSLRLEQERSRNEQDGVLSRDAAIEQTLLDLGPPIFWTCLTTALGFLALTTSSILPVRSFGIMMAIGTGAVFVCSMTILPGGMKLGPEKLAKRLYRADRVTTASLGKLIEHLKRFGWYWLGGTCVVMAVATVGLLRLDVETDFSKNFRQSSPIVRALDFFESKMGGAGAWEVLLRLPNGLDNATLDEIESLAAELRVIETDGGARITKVVSLTDGLRLVPNIAARSPKAKLRLLEDFQPEFAPSLYNEEAQLMRVVLRSNEQEASAEKLALIEEAKTLARAIDPEAEPTGTFLLLAFLVDSLLADQWTSFLVATVAIMLTMALAFRSVRYGLVSLIPNALPIALVLGAIGWFGVPVNMGTAMIASVSVGLTVDSSIHYLAAYRRARTRGLDHWAAMVDVHQHTGRALVFSHVALVGGFSVLAMSNFVPLIYFGVLVSAAMIVGLFGDLVVLPMLLTLAERGGRYASGSARND